MSRILKTLPNVITSPYGKRGNSMHNGIDIKGLKNGARVTDYIIAHTDGKVIAMQNNMNNNKKSSGTASYGNYVKIEHENGYSTLYAHMDKGSVTVKVGDYVKQGHVIGFMGDTGNSYGAHLHFEVRLNDTRINPTLHINSDLPRQTKKKEDENMADTIYTVVRGDTLSKIANKYNTTYQKLAAYNGIKNPDSIVKGQKIKIPNNSQSIAPPINTTQYQIYTVVGGDTLSKIATKYKTTFQKLATYNNIKSPNKITIGQKIKIPTTTSTIAPTVPNPKPAKPIDYPITKDLGNGDYAIIGDSKKVVIANLKCTQPTSSFNNCISGTFFNRGTKKVVSCLATTNYGVLSKINKTACHSIEGYPESVLVFYKNGEFDVVRIKNLDEVKDTYVWAIGGLGLIDMYNPNAEGFKKTLSFGVMVDFSDVLRKTSHTAIGINKDGLVYLIYVKNKTALEVNTLCKSLGLTHAVMLDGGSMASINTSTYKQNAFTKQSNIIQLSK